MTKITQDIFADSAMALSRKQLLDCKIRIDAALKERDTIRLCLDALTTEDEVVNWHICYEHNPKKLPIVLAQALGLHEIVNQSQSLGELIDSINSNSDMSLEDWDKRRAPNISRVTAVGIVLAYAYDLECVGRHGVHMYELLKKARLGNDEAIFKVLNIDSSAAYCKIVEKRFHKAFMKQDSAFIKGYAASLSNSSKKHALHRKQMRIYFRMLLETNQLSSFNNESLQELFKECGIIMSTPITSII